MAATTVTLAAIGVGPAPGARAGRGFPPVGRVAVAVLVGAPACGPAQIRSKVSGFFVDWAHRDGRGLAQLFSPSAGVLDMATKDQDTLHHSEWSEAVGRRGIAAFAAAQWRLGERLVYRGMDIYLPTDGSGGGAEVNHVQATFTDGDVQPVEEAKFNYDCAQRALTHVMITSAGPAEKPRHR